MMSLSSSSVCLLLPWLLLLLSLSLLQSQLLTSAAATDAVSQADSSASLSPSSSSLESAEDEQLSSASASSSVERLTETTSDELLQQLLFLHNYARYMHDTSALTLDPTVRPTQGLSVSCPRNSFFLQLICRSLKLTDYARIKALMYAWYGGQDGLPADPPDLTFGQNVHWTSSLEDAGNDESASNVMNSWYSDEEKKWVYGASARLSAETSEFSQLMWNTSSSLGCGQARSSGGSRTGTFTVCLYDPPGNVAGREQDNIFPPIDLVTTGESPQQPVQPDNRTGSVQELVIEPRRQTARRWHQRQPRVLHSMRALF